MSEPRRVRPQTYETFVIHSIMPADGWQAIYIGDDGHWCEPIRALALVTRRTRECHSGRVLSPPTIAKEEEFREVVGLDFHPSEGFYICDESGNFCALLPPGWTLADYEAGDNCRHVAPGGEA
jgi:hypothetical protein